MFYSSKPLAFSLSTKREKKVVEKSSGDFPEDYWEGFHHSYPKVAGQLKKK